MTDRLEHFPLVWCGTCEKIQPMLFDEMPANDKNDHAAADIVCSECKSVIACGGLRLQAMSYSSSTASQDSFIPCFFFTPCCFRSTS
jgi:hypothetical protein